MIRKNIYKWHRTASLIIAVPVLLWACSGFMHPVMTNLRPAVNMQSLNEQAIDLAKIHLSLDQVLRQNKIDSISGVRMIHIDTNWFYQVRVHKTNELSYYSAKNGNLLVRGDWLYAQYLARLFLEGKPASGKASTEGSASMRMSVASPLADCCSEAASTALNAKGGAAIQGVSLIHSFNEEYKSIYCLLPVYEVTFKRADQIRIYVETGQDRFAVAVDRNRAAFTTFFDLVHTWGWLSFLGKGRILVEVFFAGLGFLTALMGIYIFFSTKGKKNPGNPVSKARWNHRYTSIVASLFTLMFTFSGCYHALSKLKGEQKEVKTMFYAFPVGAIHLDFLRLKSLVKKPLLNIGLVQLNGKPCWQIYLMTSKPGKPKDLMRDMRAEPVLVQYTNMALDSVLKDADRLYAENLACSFGGYRSGQIVSASLVSRFTDEYNFTDKRLPVWKVSFPSHQNERLYIETSTSVLAKRTNDTELYEGYSFAFFHKHHFMDFGGKTVRDISTMFWAFAQIAMIAVGLIFYFRLRNQRSKTAGKNIPD